MRKTPNAVNTREQGKEGREGEVGTEVERDPGRDGGMVIEDIEHVLAPLKLFGVRRIDPTPSS